MSDFKEAWNRITEYVEFVRATPKFERTELEEDILRSYEQVLIEWAVEKTRPVRVFVKILCRIIRIGMQLKLL